MTNVLSNEALLARRLPIKGTFNVRDIGGYRTEDGLALKWKTILRGDALHKVDDDGRELLARYGVKTSLDLREKDERSAAPDQLHEEVQLVSLPLFSYVNPAGFPHLEPIDRSQIRSLEETYYLLIRSRGPVLVLAIQELLKPNALPAIVHCTAGKDRTGLVVALVLGALGVPEEVIAADFAATKLFLNDEFLHAMLAQREAMGADETRMRSMLACEPSLILSILEEIREHYGDVASYLLAHGLSSEELHALRSLLLENDPDARARAATI